MWANVASDYVVELAQPSDGQRVVDIGAGMGPAVVGAARRGAMVTGVDPTPYMRRILTVRRLLQRNRKAITVADGSAERLPVADGSTSIVWAVNSVHHWQDLAAAAAEIERVLAPDGRVFLVDEDFLHPAHERNKGDRAPRKRHGMDPVDAIQMAEALTAVGLLDVEASERFATPGVPVKQAEARKAGR